MSRAPDPRFIPPVGADDSRVGPARRWSRSRLSPAARRRLSRAADAFVLAAILLGFALLAWMLRDPAALGLSPAALNPL